MSKIHLNILGFLQVTILLIPIFRYSISIPLRNDNEVKEIISKRSLGNSSSAGAGLGASSLLPFLKKFGYLQSNDSSQGEHESDTLYTQESIQEAIKEMQRFADLPQSGELDAATLAMLSTPRCGIPDIIHKAWRNGNRRKRYVIGANGWNKRRLSYRVNNWSPQLSESDVLSDVKQAFSAWAHYARLRFVDVPRSSQDDADISISFGQGHHGDGYPFDGPGGVLAHAFFPYGHGPLGGDIHFDLDENWASGSTPRKSSISFLAVTVHEIGHSLGLAHSPSRDSVMFPYYQGTEDGTNANVRLGYDDIMAMYQLYIQREIQDSPDDKGTPITLRPATTEPARPIPTETPRTSTLSYSATVPSTTDDHWRRTTPVTDDEHKTTEHTLDPKDPVIPDICRDGYDAISFIRNEIFVFKDQFMWRYRKMGLRDPQYPVETRRLFPVLDGVSKVDAAFEDETGKIIFFSGNRYWVHDSAGTRRTHLLADFGLPTDLLKIDAVFVWDKNKKTYFFSGNSFWRYNATTESIDEGYPKEIARWRGIPEDGISAALKFSDGRTYFFKNNKFWRFDDTSVKAEDGFPLQTSSFWFGC